MADWTFYDTEGWMCDAYEHRLQVRDEAHREHAQPQRGDDEVSWRTRSEAVDRAIERITRDRFSDPRVGGDGRETGQGPR